tara:strand:- start:3488 stop:3682 length:195 start_codon:yes stop_codon:yes gene_type:complete
MNVEEFSYYTKYKNNLTQFIIHNCSYSKNKKRLNRINLNERQILDLLKELIEISLYCDQINNRK